MDIGEYKSLDKKYCNIEGRRVGSSTELSSLTVRQSLAPWHRLRFSSVLDADPILPTIHESRYIVARTKAVPERRFPTCIDSSNQIVPPEAKMTGDRHVARLKSSDT